MIQINPLQICLLMDVSIPSPSHCLGRPQESLWYSWRQNFSRQGTKSSLVYQHSTTSETVGCPMILDC